MGVTNHLLTGMILQVVGGWKKNIWKKKQIGSWNPKFRGEHSKKYVKNPPTVVKGTNFEPTVDGRNPANRLRCEIPCN